MDVCFCFDVLTGPFISLPEAQETQKISLHIIVSQGLSHCVDICAKLLCNGGHFEPT